MEAVAPLANDPIMSGTSIRSFRHLKHQNLSTGDDFIHSSGIFFLIPFLATREVGAPLANDPIMLGRSMRSFRYLQCQNPSIITDSIGINVGCKICDGRWKTNRRRNSSSIVSYSTVMFWVACYFSVILFPKTTVLWCFADLPTPEFLHHSGSTYRICNN